MVYTPHDLWALKDKYHGVILAQTLTMCLLFPLYCGTRLLSFLMLFHQLHSHNPQVKVLIFYLKRSNVHWVQVHKGKDLHRSLFLFWRGGISQLNNTLMKSLILRRKVLLEALTFCLRMNAASPLTGNNLSCLCRQTTGPLQLCLWCGSWETALLHPSTTSAASTTPKALYSVETNLEECPLCCCSTFLAFWYVFVSLPLKVENLAIPVISLSLSSLSL